MAEQQTLPKEVSRETKERGNADLVVAIPIVLDSEIFPATLSELSAALKLLASPYNVILALPADQPREQPAELQSASGAPYPMRVAHYVPAPADPALIPWLATTNTYGPLFSLAQKFNARACTVLMTDQRTEQESLAAETMTLMLGPALEAHFDLVMPVYTMPPFDDLLNKSILYPLTRALYGHRVRYPLANEFQLSAKLFQRLAPGEDKSAARPARGLWLGSIAANQNLKMCQAWLGTRPPQSHDGVELSSALAQLAGSLFTDMEENATFWQRVRGSREVPTFGTPAAMAVTPETVDVRRMLDAFQLGVRNLQSVWAQILPPVTLLELRKLSRLLPDQFQMPDALWVRIVYDFALAHRLRNINRNHLFGALTPLYLGWAASYAVELNTTGAAGAEERVESLARVYEAEKPYLLSRWRWPDRFNP